MMQSEEKDSSGANAANLSPSAAAMPSWMNASSTDGTPMSDGGGEGMKPQVTPIVIHDDPTDASANNDSDSPPANRSFLFVAVLSLLNMIKSLVLWWWDLTKERPGAGIAMLIVIIIVVVVSIK